MRLPHVPFERLERRADSRGNGRGDDGDEAEGIEAEKLQPAAVKQVCNDLRTGALTYLMRNAARPVIEIVDMVSDVPAVSAEQRTGTVLAHLLKLARAEAKVKGSLIG